MAQMAEFTKALRDSVFNLCKVLHFEPSTQQEEILRDYDEGIKGPSNDVRRFQTTKSGQGAGKTAMENVIAAHWVLRNQKAKMRVGANSIGQLKDTWMPEFRLMLSRAEPWLRELFLVRSQDVHVCGDRDWNIVMQPMKDVAGLQGRHDKHLGYIIDEVSGVGRDIIEAISGTLTNEDRYFGIFGNPNFRDTFQFDTFHSQAGYWTQYTLNAEESPFADKNQHRRLEETFGRDSDVYRVRVLGEFPSKDPQALMSSDDIEACHQKNKNRVLDLVTLDNRTKQLGIDLAGKGDDASVVFRRSGLAVVEFEKFNKTEPSTVVGHAKNMADRANWRNQNPLFVADFDGLGGGTGGLWEGRNLFEFHAQANAMDSDLYADALTEAFFHMSYLVREHAVYLPDDKELVQNLSTRNFGIDTKGRLKIESKKEWRRRLKLSRSPDTGDACVMAFYPVGNQESRVAYMAQGGPSIQERSAESIIADSTGRVASRGALSPAAMRRGGLRSSGTFARVWNR